MCFAHELLMSDLNIAFDLKLGMRYVQIHVKLKKTVTRVSSQSDLQITDIRQVTVNYDKFYTSRIKFIYMSTLS